MTLLEKVRQNISAGRLVANGDRLLVAVSGGVDSMVLLHLLTQLGREAGWTFSVGHLNHQLRGAESDEDERFVVQAARAAGIAVYSEPADVRECARTTGLSVEMAARKLRHEFLARSAIQAGAKVIMLAHHADDQVETFWLRVLRGNVGEGLRGMRWKNPSPANPELFLVRPLLNVSKAELLAYGREQRLAFREDASNTELHYQRNRIRHEVLPALERYQPQIREITLRLAAVLAEEKDFIRGQAKKANFSDAHPAVQREILLGQLLGAGLEPTFEHIENLRTSTKPLMLTPGIVATRSLDGVKIEALQPTGFDRSECRLRVDSPGSAEWKGVTFKWDSGQRVEPGPGFEQFDADIVGPEITLRHWRAGDRFQPIGMLGDVKLQDLFMNLKVPERERHERVLACTANGAIFWIEGIRISEIAKITPSTRRVLAWSWQR